MPAPDTPALTAAAHTALGTIRFSRSHDRAYTVTVEADFPDYSVTTGHRTAEEVAAALAQTEIGLYAAAYRGLFAAIAPQLAFAGDSAAVHDSSTYREHRSHRAVTVPAGTVLLTEGHKHHYETTGRFPSPPPSDRAALLGILDAMLGGCCQAITQHYSDSRGQIAQLLEAAA